MMVHQQSKNKAQQMKATTPKYHDSKSKQFTKLNKSKDKVSNRHLKDITPSIQNTSKQPEYLTFYCTQNQDLTKANQIVPKHITYKIYENDDEDSHTRYSNID